MLIHNKLARLDALCVIGFYSHSNYNQIQVDGNRSLQEEIEYQLDSMYVDLPLLLHTSMFIRCLPFLQNQRMTNTCLESLFSKFVDAKVEDQQAVREALSPYLQSNLIPSAKLKFSSRNPPILHEPLHNRSSAFMKYINKKINEHLSSSLLLSNMYLIELIGDVSQCLKGDFNYPDETYNDSSAPNESIITAQFDLESPILTLAQVSTLTSILLAGSSSDVSKHAENLFITLNNILHRFNLVEFKACRLLETWMKWKDSDELSSFAYHAALLLAHSDFWSVQTAIIVCDLLCCENDRFRQRAEMILRSKRDDNDIRASSKLGLDVVLTLARKKASLCTQFIIC